MYTSNGEEHLSIRLHQFQHYTTPTFYYVSEKDNFYCFFKLCSRKAHKVEFAITVGSFAADFGCFEFLLKHISVYAKTTVGG